MRRPIHSYPWFRDPEGLAELRGRLIKHVTLLLGYAESTGDEVRVQGTAVLVKGRRGHALVTARHVVDGFLELRAAETGSVQMTAMGAFGRTNTSVGDWVVRRADDRNVDIAALCVPSEFPLSSLGIEPWTGGTQPRRPVEAGDLAYALGFPGAARIQVGGQEVYGVVGVKEFIASTSERHFVMVPEDGPRKFHAANGGRSMFRPVDRVGGLSGAPVFAFVAPRVLMISDVTEEPVSWMDIVPEWELAGVIYEGRGGIDEAWLFVAHIRHLDI